MTATNDDDRTPLTDMVSRRIDRPFMVAFAFALGFTLLIALTLGYTALRLVTSANEDRDAARFEAQQVKAQLEANQRETACFRKLSGDRARADTLYSTANGDLIIAVGVKGDVQAALANLDARKVALQAADDAYYRAATEGVDVDRDCPGM